MFSYSSTAEVLPSLVFTRAELVFALTRLLQGIDDNDNSTRLELVELRHYLNMIKDEVVTAARKRELSLGALNPIKTQTTTSTPEDATPKKLPSMAELKKQFPSLTEDEIKAIISKARQEAKENEEKKKLSEPPPPPPSFIAKSEDEINISPPAQEKKKPTPKEETDKEMSKKFASMLGTW